MCFFPMCVHTFACILMDLLVMETLLYDIHLAWWRGNQQMRGWGLQLINVVSSLHPFQGQSVNLTLRNLISSLLWTKKTKVKETQFISSLWIQKCFNSEGWAPMGLSHKWSFTLFSELCVVKRAMRSTMRVVLMSFSLEEAHKLSNGPSLPLSSFCRTLPAILVIKQA